MKDVDITLGDKTPNTNGVVRGTCKPGYESIVEAFVENFESRNEFGASLHVNVKGETLVDVWGGKTRVGKEVSDWQEDTVSVIFSCTKAAVALCANMLIDQGKMSLQDKVADIWPGFGAAGKDNVTVEMMLNHSSALPALREPVKEGGYYDWQYMVDRLAAEEPFWQPGTRNGYHMITYGWTVGELVRQVSGQSLGEYFREHVAEPLGLDFWIGMPDEEHHRISRMLQWVPDKGEKVTPFTEAVMNSKTSVQHLALLNSGRHRTDQPEAYRAEIGGGGGISNARGLAGMYVPLANGGSHQGVNLISNDQLEKMRAVSVATLEDATLLFPTRFGLGFMRSMDNLHRDTGHMESCVMGREAFGHAGAGGSLGFADPECGLAFGYTMNRMGAGILLNNRGSSLVDAVYKALGYSTKAPGMWIP